MIETCPTVSPDLVGIMSFMRAHQSEPKDGSQCANDVPSSGPLPHEHSKRAKKEPFDMI